MKLPLEIALSVLVKRDANVQVAASLSLLQVTSFELIR